MDWQPDAYIATYQPFIVCWRLLALLESCVWQKRLTNGTDFYGIKGK